MLSHVVIDDVCAVLYCCAVGSVLCPVETGILTFWSFELDPQRGSFKSVCRCLSCVCIFLPRQIQNAHTGLDLSVPEYQEVRGKMMSGHVEYHIVVVTRLAAFKSAKHKPEDVVQFMVNVQSVPC